MNIKLHTDPGSGYKVFRCTIPSFAAASHAGMFINEWIRRRVKMYAQANGRSSSPDRKDISSLESSLRTSIKHKITISVSKTLPAPTHHTSLTCSEEDARVLKDAAENDVVAVLVLHQGKNGRKNDDDWDDLYLMGFNTAMGFSIGATVNEGLRPVPFTSQSSLAWDLLEVTTVRRIVVAWNDESQRPPQVVLSVPCLPINDGETQGVFERGRSPDKTNAGAALTSKPVAKVITDCFASPIYIFNIKATRRSDMSDVSVHGFVSEYRKTFGTYCKLFAEWKSAAHGYRSGGVANFGSCVSPDREFGKRCIKQAQYDADSSMLFGTTEQAIKTNAAVLHSAAQAAAILIINHSDYGMVNWLATCWAIHTKIRLTYYLYSPSYDYSSRSAAAFAATLGVPVRAMDEWLESRPVPFDAEAGCTLCEDVAAYNSIDSGIPLSVTDGTDEPGMDMIGSEVQRLLAYGVSSICRAVEKYAVGFGSMEQENPSDDIANRPVPVIPEYCMNAYREAMSSYGSCLSVAGVTENPHMEFIKQRRIKEKNDRRDKTKDPSAKMFNYSYPDLGLPLSYESKEFGFPMHDPCVEEGSDECSCGIQDINWSDHFREALGFDPPSVQEYP